MHACSPNAGRGRAAHHHGVGEPAADATCATARFISAPPFGNIVVALAPDRGRTCERRAEYHDLALPPRHALAAFAVAAARRRVDALVHAAHGTLVAARQGGRAHGRVSPRRWSGRCPWSSVHRQQPGEAAQAKRRIAAVTLGHLPPPLVGTDLSGARASSSAWSTNTPRPTAPAAAASGSRG
jgi:cobaltochelatase CobN